MVIKGIWIDHALLCEFPSWSKYKGTGGVNAASSYSCSR
ncbi:tannase/feruloyl esterase family alpha/beta hydrolase [Metabacillus sediminilitoris]|uniref:Tannase/feruloyl esterase family alpha/beta hydrolase n=1 Tax=Metabacillus sediminilitoris TaxID=2567941 RepID=A0A4S4BYP0_9BACI|nr:tannase/feruloyl esterase family alpha/beta hydrolase [Metabacillus sediminilitoris]THF80269.1 tannase/feruloyl esterase family alpha/beta hydrolase [Metabacillus sediminilitoris]